MSIDTSGNKPKLVEVSSFARRLRLSTRLNEFEAADGDEAGIDTEDEAPPGVGDDDDDDGCEAESADDEDGDEECSEIPMVCSRAWALLAATRAKSLTS
jgi:hypothetical protein